MISTVKDLMIINDMYKHAARNISKSNEELDEMLNELLLKRGYIKRHRGVLKVVKRKNPFEEDMFRQVFFEDGSFTVFAKTIDETDWFNHSSGRWINKRTGKIIKEVK